MKFSFFSMPLHLPNENPALAFKRDIDLIKTADDLGYDGFFVGEHHTAAWENIPSPELFLSKASAYAKRIQLGSSLVSLPFHHPFNVAERFAFLDHLTEGRAVLGVGPCSLPPDVKLYGIPPQELNPMMRESLEIIDLLLKSDEPISYSGKYWNIKDMFIQLKSFQQPRLPYATASVGSERSIEFASMYDMHLWSLALENTPPNSIHWSKQWQKAQEISEKLGTNPLKDDWRVVTYVHLAETSKQAWDEVEKAIERDIHEYFYVITGTEGWLLDKERDPYSLTAKEIVKSRNWIIGTPDEAIKKIKEMDEKAEGLGGLMFTTHEWTSQNSINNSLELFARYVMPEFKGHTKSIKKAWELTKEDRKNNKIPSLSSKDKIPNTKEHKSNLFLNR